MIQKKQSFKQLSEIIGVSYRTLLAWRKSRPEMVERLLLVDKLQSENDRIKSIITSVHNMTRE